jgi:hypothetical protein
MILRPEWVEFSSDRTAPSAVGSSKPIKNALRYIDRKCLKDVTARLTAERLRDPEPSPELLSEAF